jgi:type I site-specific restriction endonuclease
VQEKLVALMKEIFALHKMDNYYSVDFTNSKVNNGKTLKKWIQNNTRTSKIVNIVIAVDQLSCGVTLPTCDMVVLWNDSVSESEYIQRTERCKNPKDGVENVYVVDFNPHRCLQSHGMQIETITKKEIDVNVVSEYLPHINIMLYDGSGKFKIIDPEVLVKDYEKYNYPLKQFSRLKINDDFDNEAEEYLSHTSVFSSKNTKTVTLLDSDLGREDGIQNKEIISSDRTRESKKKEKERIQKLKMILELQPLFHLITGFKFKRPQEIYDFLLGNK